MADDTHEIAEVANQLAQQANAQAGVNGVIQSWLISCLLENGTISFEEAQAIFQNSYNFIIETMGESISRDDPLAKVMLEMLRRNASGFNISIDESA